MLQGESGNKDVLKGESVLNDDEMIYQRERNKQTFKELSSKEKKWYLLNYYWWILPLVALILFIVFGMIIPMFTKVNPLINIVELNQLSTTYDEEYIPNNFSKYEDITPEEVSLSTLSFSNVDDPNSAQAFTVRVSAQDIDVIIGAKSLAEHYSESQSVFCDLETTLPDDMVKQLKDYFVTMTDADGNEHAYALDYSKSKLMSDSKGEFQDGVMCIIVNSPSKDMAIEFIRYAFGLTSVPIE